MKRKLKELTSALTGCRLIGSDQVVISGLTYDSRRVQPGDLFLAVSGFKQNGASFIPDAVAAGAAAVAAEKDFTADVPTLVVPDMRRAMPEIAARFYGFPGRRLTVIGVTGTNGKSTSVYLVYKILEAADLPAGMANSLYYDTKKTRYKAARTTPEAVDLQRYMAEMIEAGCTHCVLEVSSHALILSRVENIDFKVGLYTNFSRDHLDFHKSMEQYLAAKKSFLDKLVGDNKTAVINLDVPEFAAFSGDTRGRALTYAVETPGAEVTIREPRLLPEKSVFRLVTPAGETEIELPLPGYYNLANAVAAAAAGIALGIDPELIARGLKTAQPLPGRFQPVKRGQPFLLLIDYAHTPDALNRLCRSARPITPGRLLILFGCGGDRDRGKRPLMAEAASANSDFAVVTSDNPRTEDPNRIIDDILPGLKGDDYVVIVDRREAIRDIIGRAREGDTVILAGKGAEDYQEIGTTRYPFEDITEAVKALDELGYRTDQKE